MDPTAKNEKTNDQSTLLASWIWAWFLPQISLPTVDGRNPANHLGCTKPCKWWDKPPTFTGSPDFWTIKQYETFFLMELNSWTLNSFPSSKHSKVIGSNPTNNNISKGTRLITKHFRYHPNGGLLTYKSCMFSGLCKGKNQPQKIALFQVQETLHFRYLKLFGLSYTALPPSGTFEIWRASWVW